MQRGRFGISAAIGLFLAVQLLLPLRGLVYDRYETRADFSWSMFSHSYHCDAQYRGPHGAIDAFSSLKRRADAPLLLHLDALSQWHRWLCAKHGRVVATVRCMADGTPARDLVSAGKDICPQ